MTPQLPAGAAQPASPQQGQTAALVPIVSASDLPHARPLAHGRNKAKATGPAAAPATETEAAPAPATATAAAATTPAPTDSAAPAPQDSAASLVPVIPSAAPPPADPFVKAVQDDIEGK